LFGSTWRLTGFAADVFGMTHDIFDYKLMKRCSLVVGDNRAVGVALCGHELIAAD
jgi:hypothetical protein